MSDDTSGFFDNAGREGAPSAQFDTKGDSVRGQLVEKYKIDYVPYGKKEPAKDERTGEVIKQLVLVLQTDKRNWDGVSKTPEDADGNRKDPSLDTGRRAVYARPGTNIYSAIGKAIMETLPAGEKPGEHPLVGAEVAVQFFDTEDTGKGNPLKKYRAKYKAPEPASGDDGFFDEPDGGKKTEPASSGTPVDEPPF